MLLFMLMAHMAYALIWKAGKLLWNHAKQDGMCLKRSGGPKEGFGAGLRCHAGGGRGRSPHRERLGAFQPGILRWNAETRSKRTPTRDLLTDGRKATTRSSTGRQSAREGGWTWRIMCSSPISDCCSGTRASWIGSWLCYHSGKLSRERPWSWLAS